MATYNSLISSTDADDLIPTPEADQILKAIPEASSVMRMAKRLPNMSSKTYKQPVVSALPTAYFVNGETGLKQTTEVNWDGVTITAEELAVIVPIPESVLADSKYPIWEEIRPLIVEAFGVAFDAAVLVGTNAPTSWPDDILTAAGTASQTVDYSTQVAAGDDIFDMIMGEDGLLSLVEADGFMATGHVALPLMKGKLRGLRDSNGNPIFANSMQNVGGYVLDGAPVDFVKNGAFASTSAYMFSGEWEKLVYAMRQDITFKLFDQGVVTDASGNIVYNLMQQDMVALRAVMRLGWQLPNPINRVEGTAASRYPFAVLVP